MKTDAEWWQEHRGHTLPPGPGERWSKTCSITYGSLGYPGEANCPIHGKEQVMMTGTICSKHPRGQHIKIRCTKCGATGTTKNIDFIGARTIFVDCQCEEPEYEHVCEDRNV